VTHPHATAGFLVRGGPTSLRQVVAAADAFAAYAGLEDDRVDPTAESYLSMFRFPRGVEDYMSVNGNSISGYADSTWAPWLWFDIDRADLKDALVDAQRLTRFLLQQYSTLDEDDLLVFFSGSKGFHVGLPLPHAPEPSAGFHTVCRTLAEGLTATAGVTVDTAVYDRVRLFRAPNSRHPKSGLHKRRLTHRELMGLTVDRIRELARQPEAFNVRYPCRPDDQLADDWSEAETRAAVRTRPEVGVGVGTGRIHRATLEFIRFGAEEGGRNRALFAAAANLAESGVPQPAVEGLLTEAALNSGLPPGEVAATIANAVGHVVAKGVGGGR
jgi:hypothetical protein